MFTLARSETFKTTVKTHTKMENGGWREESFVAIFNRPAAADIRAMHEEGMKDEAVLRRWMCGWEMEDQSRNKVEFTPEHFEVFLSQPGAVRDTVRQFMKDAAGVKEKN